MSPGLVRLIGLSAAQVSFAGATALLRELAGVIVSVKRVERIAESLGADIAEDEQRRIDPKPRQAATMNLGIDGTGVPTRKSETEGRAGKQPDGSARTREMKLAVIWTAETTDDKGRVRADAMSASYNAAIESASTGDCDRELSAFAQRVDRRGFHDVERQVVIGDGARWIWSICDELFPRAIQIVDIWHAKERVWDVAKSVYGPGTDLCTQWAKAQKKLLRAGDIEALLEAMSDHRATDDEADKAYNYFSRNRDRMRYRTFRDDGLCVSSGMVEGGCKNAIGARLKRGGMHWTVRGANEIAALRSCVLSNRFDDYWYEKSASR